MESLKSELIKKIISISDEDILKRIASILESEKTDFWNELTENQKKEVEIGLVQAENGETVSWDNFLKKVS